MGQYSITSWIVFSNSADQQPCANQKHTDQSQTTAHQGYMPGILFRKEVPDKIVTGPVAQSLGHLGQRTTCPVGHENYCFGQYNDYSNRNRWPMDIKYAAVQDKEDGDALYNEHDCMKHFDPEDPKRC